jgi:hypothetical protein
MLEPVIKGIRESIDKYKIAEIKELTPNNEVHRYIVQDQKY